VMEFAHVTEVFRSIRLPRFRVSGRHEPSAAGWEKVSMMCTCESEHAGRPQDEEGCGAYWNIKLGPAQP
jgi:hypothetical protein